MSLTAKNQQQRTDGVKSAEVLVVDDERSLADLFADFLASTYTVRTAYNGTQALDMVSDETDVVLLDRRMPDLSGKEVLETIHEEGYNCRVAMVSAVTPDIDIVEMGFDDYLTKPVSREDLLETVDWLLELDDYDDLVGELYQLASKRAALEVEHPEIDLSEYEEFSQLTERLAELEDGVRDERETTSEVDIRTLLDRLGPVSTDR